MARLPAIQVLGLFAAVPGTSFVSFSVPLTEIDILLTIEITIFGFRVRRKLFPSASVPP